MDNQNKSGRHKLSTKKPPPKPKAVKKKKSDHGPTCSMFLAEISRKLALKKRLEREEEEPKNIAQTIIESLTNALPVLFSKKSLVNKESPMKIEKLQALAPELLPNDTLNIPAPDLSDVCVEEEKHSPKSGYKMPKMPVISSDVMKQKRTPVMMEDASVNTKSEHDVASEIAKHVNTLRKISLIAEEFNQKTAKNLKEIVDSVQDDLIKKLDEIKAEQKAAKQQHPQEQIVEQMEVE